MLALSFAAVRDCCRQERLAWALGLWNLVILVGFLLGSLLGGWLADGAWRLALPALRADVPGLLSIAAAMVLTLWGVSHGVEGFQSRSFWLPSLGGLLLFGVHGLIEHRRREPIFPVALYRRGPFLAAVLSGIGWNFAQAAVQLQTSNFWQVVQHLRTSQVALAQVPLLVCFGAGGLLAGRLMGAGRRTGLLLLTPIQATSSVASLQPALLLVGLGLAFVAVPQSALFVQEAPERCFGAVTAFRTTTGQLGFASGFAVSGALVHGFGLADLRQRLLAQGIPPTALSALLERGRTFLNHGLPAGAPLPPPEPLRAMQQAHAAGVAGAMAVTALAVAVLLAVSVGLVGKGTGPRAPADGG